MAGISEQPFHLLNCFVDHAAGLTDLHLAFQLNEGLIGGVKSPCEDCRYVKECDRVLHEQGVCIGDVKLRGFQSTHFRCVWLI
jgi:hypothetical protein